MNNQQPSQSRRMQQQSFNRGRMQGRFSGVKEKPKNMKTSIKRLAGYITLNKTLFIFLFNALQSKATCSLLYSLFSFILCFFADRQKKNGSKIGPVREKLIA